jgi:DNA-binding transcriptional ArsR family regulator
MENLAHLRFHALGDATRLAVVERLLAGPASVSELAGSHAMVLSAFTKHLGILETAGLIESRKHGRVRTCRINPGAIAELEGWFADRRRLWAGRLDRLEAQLATGAPPATDDEEEPWTSGTKPS